MNKILLISLIIFVLTGLTAQNDALVKLIKQQNENFESRIKSIEQQLELNRNQNKEILIRLESLTNGIKQLNVSYVDAISQYSVSSFNLVKGKATDVGQGVVDGTLGLVNQVTNSSTQALDETFNFGKEMVGNLLNKTSDTKNRLGDVFKDIFG
jgi:uncharacterized protein YsxB (DUF464 family)